jgi:hypothetical protein
MNPLRARCIQTLFLAALASFSTLAAAREITYPSDMPADRILANVQAWIKTHPQDSAAYCVLGRIYGLAWAYGDQIPMWSPGAPDGLPTFSEFTSVLVSRTGPPEDRRLGINLVKSSERKDRPITAADAAHLGASIAAYQQAIKLDPNDALSELGLGAMLAQQGLYARKLPPNPFSPSSPTNTEIAAWKQSIAQLASEDPSTRDAASKSLLAAMPHDLTLLQATNTDDPETNSRIDAIVRTWFDLQALDHYRRAFFLRSKEDLKAEPNFQTDCLISAKAGAQILPILSAHPQAARKDEITAIQSVLEPLAKKTDSLSQRG